MYKYLQRMARLCKCGCGEAVSRIYKWVDYNHYKHWSKTSDAALKAKVKADRKKLNAKKINHLSKKRKKQNNKYLILRNKHLEDNPVCEYQFKGCTYYSTEIDHTKGRIGKLLTDVRYFKATCRNCHDLRHKNNLVVL